MIDYIMSDIIAKQQQHCYTAKALLHSGIIVT
jgi:hypothetical protein